MKGSSDYTHVVKLDQRNAEYFDASADLLLETTYVYSVTACYNSCSTNETSIHSHSNAIKFNLFSDEWTVLEYRYSLIDWAVPQALRNASHRYVLEVLTDTGFQLNRENVTDAKKCNWASPPSATTTPVGLGTSFYLVRCKRGTGNSKVTVKRAASGGVPPITQPVSLKEWLFIEESWHQDDHHVGYRVQDPIIGGDPDQEHQELTRVGVVLAAAIWNGRDGTHRIWQGQAAPVNFGVDDVSPDVVVKGYVNPGTEDDECGGSIACFAGSGVYPHYGQNRALRLEFPPQFPDDVRNNRDKNWTNNINEVNSQPDFFHYLRGTLMHEFGHAAGLGHAPAGTGIMAGDLHEAPQTYDIEGMRHNYEGYTRDTRGTVEK